MTDLSASADARSRTHELESRAGYDPAFLGVDVPLPTLATNEPTVELRYLHYSLLFRPDRRLAAVTAVALDGARLIQVDRTDNWELDPRLAAELQAGPPVYAHNDLDRGHLVMRASATWGATEEEAQQAEADTFYFTNAAPQNKLFNQGRELWLGLEEYLQEHADAFDRKLVVLAGPVLDPADPPYRDVQVPLRFWKVVAFVQDGALAATGYLLDQTPLVDDLGAAIEETVPGQLPPLGPFRTFQVPIADIAALAGVTLDQLVAVDLLESAVTGAAPGEPTPWIELQSLDDVVLAA
jgi:endonuclease G, mitochondrial